MRTAGVRLTLGDTATADSLLGAVITHGRGSRADALLMRALLAAAHNAPLAGVALREALAAGADTAQVRAALSLLAVRSSRWREAAFEAHGALAAARGTFRHPYPGEFLTQALSQIALDAPAPLADSLLSYVIERRPELALLSALGFRPGDRVRLVRRCGREVCRAGGRALPRRTRPPSCESVGRIAACYGRGKPDPWGRD